MAVDGDSPLLDGSRLPDPPISGPTLVDLCSRTTCCDLCTTESVVGQPPTVTSVVAPPDLGRLLFRLPPWRQDDFWTWWPAPWPSPLQSLEAVRRATSDEG